MCVWVRRSSDGKWAALASGPSSPKAASTRRQQDCRCARSRRRQVLAIRLQHVAAIEFRGGRLLLPVLLPPQTFCSHRSPDGSSGPRADNAPGADRSPGKFSSPPSTDLSRRALSALPILFRRCSLRLPNRPVLLLASSLRQRR